MNIARHAYCGTKKLPVAKMAEMQGAGAPTHEMADFKWLLRKSMKM